MPKKSKPKFVVFGIWGILMESTDGFARKPETIARGLFFPNLYYTKYLVYLIYSCIIVARVHLCPVAAKTPAINPYCSSRMLRLT